MPLHLPFGVLDGITYFTELAIKEIEDLAEIIEEHKMYSSILPEHLIEDISCLTSHLQTFRPDDNIPIFLGPGMEVRQIIHNNLEVAWYLSACVYFHNRINYLFVDDTSIPVDTILVCLHCAEELKALVEPEVMHRDPPVTFPAFAGPVTSKTTSRGRPCGAHCNNMTTQMSQHSGLLSRKFGISLMRLGRKERRI